MLFSGGMASPSARVLNITLCCGPHPFVACGTFFGAMFWQIKQTALANKIFHEPIVTKGPPFVHEIVLNQDIIRLI